MNACEHCGADRGNNKQFCSRACRAAQRPGARLIPEILSLYASGKSMAQIASALSLHPDVVRARLRQAGKARTRGDGRRLRFGDALKVSTDWSFFPLNADKAWLLGLIYGDGNLSRNQSLMCIACGDRDVAQKVQAIFGGKITIVDKRSWFLVYWNSVRLWNELSTECGLMPNKARRLRWPKSVLSLPMLPHFVRGLLDSDGAWLRNRGEEITFQYVSACKPFVVKLRDVLIRHCHCSVRAHVRFNSKSAWILTYGDKDSFRVGEWLYRDSNAGNRCDRKYGLWEKSRHHPPTLLM